MVTLHQRRPSYVVECEGAHLALDDALAAGGQRVGHGPAAGAEDPVRRRGTAPPTSTGGDRAGAGGEGMRNTTLADRAREAYGAGRRLVAPLMGFPGVEMIGSSIKIAQQNFGEHYKAIRSLVDAFAPDAVFPLMDLAVEANALGRYTIFPQNESATVPKDHFGPADLERLAGINITFDSRLLGYVETVKMMSVTLPAAILRGAYVTGPFTLAGLMMGADDAVMATIDDPKGLHALCHFTTERIQEYVQLLIAAGADLIAILEPTAVMLSPGAVRGFLRASTCGTSPRASATAGSASCTTRAATPCTWSGRWSARGCTGSASTPATSGSTSRPWPARCRPRWWSSATSTRPRPCCRARRS